MADLSDILAEKDKAMGQDLGDLLKAQPQQTGGDLGDILAATPPAAMPAPEQLKEASPAVQMLRGKPVAPGMPTGVEQMGSAEPLKGMTDVGRGIADVPNVAASLITGTLQPVAETVARPIAGQKGVDTIRQLAAKVQPQTEAGRLTAGGISLPFTTAAEASKYLLTKAGMSPEKAEEIVTGAAAGLVLGGLGRGPILSRTAKELPKPEATPEELLTQNGLTSKGVTPPKGKREALYWFNDPVTGSTLALPESKMNNADIVQHVKESREKFHVGETMENLSYVETNTKKLSKELVSTVEASGKTLEHPPTLDVALGKRLRGMQSGGIAIDSAEKMLKAGAKKAGYDDSVSQAGAMDYFQAVEGKDGLKASIENRRPVSPDEIHDFIMRRANTTRDPVLKAGYLRAADIATDPKYAALRTHIQEAHQHLEKQWDALNQAGVVEGYLQGYVRMVAEKAPKVATQLQGLIDNGMLQTNPSFVKQRFYDSFYRGEQVGIKYKAKNFDEMLMNYDRAAMQALADRNFIANAFNGIEKDDPLQRPILNISQSRPVVFRAGEQPTSILSLSPRTPQDVTTDYIQFNHPAFRNWIWKTTDEKGNPVYRQGQLSVNPASFKKFERLFKPSAIDTASMTIGGKTIYPGRMLTGLSSEVKGTALVGPFHGINIGFHAIERNVSPFFRARLEDLMRDPQAGPLLQEGMEHGLMVQAPNMIQKYGEGLVGGGLWRHVPGIGQMLHSISDWTFNRLIPESAAKMYLASFDKNMARYSKPGWFGLRRGLTRDEISELTAKQVNNASGMQNDQWLALKGTGMFHSQTWLDMERLFMLAPEFLKARVKFTGEAAMPFMHEQRVALLRGALYLWAASRVLNVTLSDDHDPHLETPLGVKIGDTVFTFRNIPSDIAHGIQDPRSFFWNRVNPSTTKPAMELLTGRDPVTGRERDLGQQIHDLFSNASPRAVSAPFRDNEDTRMFNLLRGVLSAFAVSSYKYLTPAEKTAQKLYWQHLPSSIDPKTRDRLDAMRQAEEIVASGGTLAEAQRAYMDRGVQVTAQDLMMLAQNRKQTHLERYTKHLNAEALMDVWKDMDDAEKSKMKMMILQKVMASRTLPGDKRVQFLRDLGFSK